MFKPDPSEYTPYFHRYISMVMDVEPTEALETTFHEVNTFLRDIPTEKATYRYAPGKWTVNEVIGHVMDTERIFQYRVLRMLREDNPTLAGFDQDAFAERYAVNGRNLAGLLDEFEVVRTSTRLLFHGLSEEDVLRSGNSDGKTLSVRAAAFIVCGHAMHHVNVIRERYL